jgi:hypothetical protein
LSSIVGNLSSALDMIPSKGPLPVSLQLANLSNVRAASTRNSQACCSNAHIVCKYATIC